MYRRGWFPMYDDDSGRVQWVQPRRRAVLPLGAFRVPRTLRSVVRSRRFEVTSDRAFDLVIQGCATPAPGREKTWLCPEIIGLFEALHRAGLAHSVEAWKDGVLVGGLYGLAIGSVFCGESMFSRPELGGTNASKVCLVHLAMHLKRRGFTMLDAQLHNPHLEQFGLEEVPSGRFVLHLRENGGRGVDWGALDGEAAVRELERA
jgi:leucyl/phenylalanyl-tRNA--protein transferase